jgi:transposase
MKVRHPTTNEIQQLSKRILTLADPHQRRRAETLILYGMGLNPSAIAVSQGVHPNTVYKDLHAFERVGMEAVTQLRGRGAPSRITDRQVIAMVQLAEQSPQVVGLPHGRWSLRKLSVYLVKKHMVKSIGRERLRQLLKKRSAFPASATQVAQPRPTATSNSGSPALDFQAFAQRWASLVLRCQAHRSQSVRWAALHFSQTFGAVA